MTDQRAMANRLISAKGMALTITRRTAAAYNPATGSTAISTSTQTGRGVMFDYPPGLKKMAGTNIAIGERQLLLSALNSAGAAITAPQVDDEIVWGSKVYLVTAVDTLDPAGSALMFTCTVRGTGALPIVSTTSLTVLSSGGAAYLVPRTALDSAGTIFTVTAVVLNGNGTSYTVV